MNLSGHNDRDRVLEATDLVRLIGEHVALRRKGREFVGLCPFHDDHAPSLCVVTHKGTPFYKCFACGASGTAIDFVINYHKMPFIEALRFLAERAGIELSRRRIDDRPGRDEPSRSDLISANETAREYFQRVLAHAQAGQAARDMLQRRGVSSDMIEKFTIGAAPDDWEALATLVRKRGLDVRAFRDAGLLKERAAGSGLRDTFVNRLIFPIADQLGRTIAFGGRILNPDDKPKYLNSPESPVFQKSKTLYGLHLAQKSIGELNEAIVTEGYTDAIALHEHGFPNAVATLGTAFTHDHARILLRFCDTVILLFDSDEAGQKAADRPVEIFFAQPIDVRICILPDGCDPDELLKRETGEAQLHERLRSADDVLAFIVRRFMLELEGTDTISGRQKRAESLLARLADAGLSLTSGTQREATQRGYSKDELTQAGILMRKRMILPRLAQLLGVSIRDVERALPRRRGPAAARKELPTPSSIAAGAALERDIESLRRVSRALRTAEEDVLSILLFEPATCNERVPIGDGHSLPLAEAYPPEAFRDETCRAVYEAIYSRLDSDLSFDVADIQGRCEEDRHRSAVMELYFRGRSFCGGEESRAGEKLRAAIRAFDLARGREEVQRRIALLKSGNDPDAAANTMALAGVCEELRPHGGNRAALARGVRS